jgi:hypothetical protein
MNQFLRNVKILIGGRGDTGFLIEGLKISFEIEKTSKRFPNKAKIEICNLSKSNSSKLEVSKDLSVQLFAGYGQDPPLIFSGDIRKGRIITDRNGVDRVTKIEASSGYNAYTRSKIARSYKSGITVGQIIKDFEDSFKFKIRLPDDINTDLEFSSGLVLAGRTSDVFQNIADSIGVDWYFEDGVIRIVGKDSDTGEKAILLTEKTGLVGTSKKTNKGANAVALLNSEIRPRRIVQIEDSVSTGFFRVQKVAHKGDNWGGSFLTEFEAVQIGGKG